MASVSIGVHKALMYAFPANQVAAKFKTCGNKIEPDEYVKLFSDETKAREFLNSLPRIGKYCARIAALMKKKDIYDLDVVDAYFLGTAPSITNSQNLSHLSLVLFLQAIFAIKSAHPATRNYFLSRMNDCSIRYGTVVEANRLAISADMMKLSIAGNNLVIETVNEKLFQLPFFQMQYQRGQTITVHWSYVIEALTPDLVQAFKKSIEHEIMEFNRKVEL